MAEVEIQIVDQIFIRKSLIASARADLWFIHGFAESSFSFQEAFRSPLAKEFNLYVPDLPGFGVSPPHASFKSLDSIVGCLKTVRSGDIGNKTFRRHG